MDAVPWQVIGPLLAAVALIDAVALVDLARHDTALLPKAGWAAVIILSFPLGVILYATVGRVPREPGLEAPAAAAAPRATPSPSITIDVGTPQAEPPTRPSDASIRTTALSKDYDGILALDAVDLAVPRGATYGLVGPNGAGKTTLLSVLAGLRSPTAGGVAIDAPRRRVAVLPDTPRFDRWLTGREVVSLAHRLVTAPGDTAAGDVAVGDALARTGLSEAADRRVGGYSRGMLQRLGLATCLVGDPEVLLLDEPCSALDPAGRREVLDLIAALRGDATVLLSTHILADVQQVCDTVGVLAAGQLRFQGPLGDLLARTRAAFLVRVRPPVAPVLDALATAAVVAGVEERPDGQLLVEVRDVDAAEHELPRLIAGAGAALVTFGPAADLEAAFLEVTG